MTGQILFKLIEVNEDMLVNSWPFVGWWFIWCF